MVSHLYGCETGIYKVNIILCSIKFSTSLFDFKFRNFILAYLKLCILSFKIL
jgi:hypothetical protein